MQVRTFVFALLGVAAVALPCFAGDDVRVVVGFKGTADASVVRSRGAAVVETLSARRAIVVTMAPKDVAALRADASVAYVEEDGIAEASGDASDSAGKPGSGGSAPPAQTHPWGVDKVWGNVAPAATGAGVNVAVVDTGIDLDHPDLQANVKGNVTFVSRTSSGDDDNGHGSHVAGIVAAVDNTIGYVGVARGANLYAVKVLDKRGSGFNSSVAAGIDWAVANGMHVVNMSLGSSSNSSAVGSSCDAASSAGLLLVAAAGNSGDGSTSTTELSYPAALSSVVAVGATTSSDGLASFSNTGSFVEMSAPGVSIPSTYKGGGYATLSGTSMACPHVVGLAALLWSAGTSGSAVRDALHTHVVDLGSTGRDAGFGFGRAYYLAQ